MVNVPVPAVVAAKQAASDASDGLINKVAAFIEAASLAASDGLTWSEFGELMLSLLRLVMTSLDMVASLTGPQKKALAVDAVARLFDAVADQAVPAAVYPLWLLVRSPVRALVVAIASGAIEQLLPLVRAAA
jgi:hypothetical protein